MNANVAAGEKLAILGTIDPQTVANTEKFSDVIDMNTFHQVLAIAMTGDMASETIDFKCYTCDSDGTNATALKTATQLAASASANDNAQVAISVRADDLVATSKRYIKFGLVTGGATGGAAAAVVLGVDGRYAPESASNLATVKQVKL
jgi:hypothetical protein